MAKRKQKRVERNKMVPSAFKGEKQFKAYSKSCWNKDGTFNMDAFNKMHAEDAGMTTKGETIFNDRNRPQKKRR